MVANLRNPVRPRFFHRLRLRELLRSGYRNDVVRYGPLVLIALLLLTVRISTWPGSWFDEGLNLATASTIAQDNVYGLPDSEGTRVMDPAIQTGPPVILPVALSFKMFGVGLTQARIVMVLFGIIALAGFLMFSRRVAGAAGASMAAIALLIGSGDQFTSFVPLSRQVLGEVPAIGFICFGMWLLARHIDTPARPALQTGIAVGILFGLAMVTKSQVAITLPAAVGLFWLLNIFYYRATSKWLALFVLVTSVLVVLSWYVTQILIVGYDGFQANREVLSEGFGIHIARLSASGPEAAMRALVSTGFVFWGLPGLVYGALLARHKTRDALVISLPVIFIGLWLFWYTFLSIGWSRYAAIPLMLTPILTARLLVDMLTGVAGREIPRQLARLIPVGAVVVILGLGISFLKTDIPSIASPPSSDHQAITNYLQHEIPGDTVIETWAWELDSFVPQSLHHPPTGVTNAYTLLIWDGDKVPPGLYDPAAAGATYVLEDSFSAWTGIYSDFIDDRGTLIAEFGEYRLYQVR